MHRTTPNMYLANRTIRKPMLGSGMGSILMSRGGPGAGSSYESIPDFEHDTGIRTVGGSMLSEKLTRLMVKPLVQKPQNIRF